MPQDDLTDRRRSRVAQRLDEMQERESSGEGRNVDFALNEIERLCDALNLSKPVQTIAESLYRQVLDADLLRGRSIEGVASAVVYIASRQAEDIRTLDEMARPSRVSQKQIGKIYRDIASELDIPLSPAQPADYIRRFVEEGGCDDYDVDCKRLRDTAMTIVGECRDRGLMSGRSPSGYAAASIYVVGRDLGAKVTQAELADYFDVSEVTIRKAYKDQVRVGKELGLIDDDTFPKIQPSD